MYLVFRPGYILVCSTITVYQRDWFHSFVLPRDCRDFRSDTAEEVADSAEGLHERPEEQELHSEICSPRPSHIPGRR